MIKYISLCRRLFFVAAALSCWFFNACTPGNTPEGAKAPVASGTQQGTAPSAKDLSKYEIAEMPGTNLRRAVLRNEAGKVIEQGFVDENGLQTGEWLAFYAQNSLPYKLITYKAGVQNGLYIFFNEIGQVTLLATYKDNKLDGYWVKYRFGRPEEEAEYKDGKMHGVHRQYFVREGWLQFTTEYKDGVKDGMYRAYNKDGQVTLEYEFRNGQQVSGGMK